MQPVPDLVFDLGSYMGDDSWYYLKKGFRVVAVEANPELIHHCRYRFAQALEEGRLTLLHLCLDDAPGERTFYVNENPGFSSMHEHIAGRRFTYRTVDVPTGTLDSLIAEHGMPHFIKMDIEGGENAAVRALQRVGGGPTYLSLEVDFYEGDAIADLVGLGYERFALVKQPFLEPDPELPHFEFTPCSSGRFDPGIFDDGLTADEARAAIDALRTAEYQWHDLWAAGPATS